MAQLRIFCPVEISVVYRLSGRGVSEPRTSGSNGLRGQRAGAGMRRRRTSHGGFAAWIVCLVPRCRDSVGARIGRK
jgi:hypothetical protein